MSTADDKVEYLVGDEKVNHTSILLNLRGVSLPITHSFAHSDIYRPRF